MVCFSTLPHPNPHRNQMSKPLPNIQTATKRSPTATKRLNCHQNVQTVPNRLNPDQKREEIGH